MIRHYLIAALRNMAANRLLSGIAILGLAVGLTTAILMALVIRNQLTYDDFIPGYDRTYMGATQGADPGAPPWIMDRTHRQFAALLTLNIPQIEDATRLMVTDAITGGNIVFKRGNVTRAEKIYWADPNMFDVLPLPALYGDPKTALRRPDGIVLPRAAARKYFGRNDAVGQILQLNGHPMMVRAVIEDLPANGTELESGIFASNLAPFLGFYDYKASPPGQFKPADIGVRTYFRLRPGASIAAVQARATTLIKPIYTDFRMPLIRLDRVHLVEDLNADVMGGLNAGVMARMAVAGLAGVLVLFIAAVNFVNLMLARAARRERDVGVRKASGASRKDLILQFLGEAIVATLVAALLAVALSEWLLPAVNAFLQTGARSSMDPLLAGAFLLGIVAVGIAAGAYPAFVLSAFTPASVLKGTAGVATGHLRNGLVVAQFAILIVLAIASAVVWQQRDYATRAALRVDTDQILVVRIPGQGVTCPEAFKTQIAQLGGVRSLACSGAEFLDLPATWRYRTKDGYSRSFDLTQMEWSGFATYGIKPIAGALADRPGAAPGIVINQAAVKVLGFASAEAAIGKTLPYAPGTADKIVSPIIAVVPDFALDPVTRAVKPTLFVKITEAGVLGSLLHVKLDGRQIPETLAAIDRAWRATGQTLPIDRFFMDQHMQDKYVTLLREAQMFAICAGVAILLACLGLIGISTATAERRTKEIGVRKAMGARDGDILTLLLWRFARPVLWANLIAWPLAWWAMRRWLSGFPAHVSLNWWLFPVAGAATLVIALATVAGQAWVVARRKPVLALRYE